MGLAELEGADPPDVRLIVVPRGEYEVLDDWGELIGLKGSGSNSVVVDDVFVPADHVVPVAQLMGEWPVTTTQLPVERSTTTRCTAAASWASPSAS